MGDLRAIESRSFELKPQGRLPSYYCLSKKWSHAQRTIPSFRIFSNGSFRFIFGAFGSSLRTSSIQSRISVFFSASGSFWKDVYCVIDLGKHANGFFCVHFDRNARTWITSKYFCTLLNSNRRFLRYLDTNKIYL